MNVEVEDTYIVSPCKNSVYDGRFSWYFLSETRNLVSFEAWRCSNYFEPRGKPFRLPGAFKTSRLFPLRYRGHRVLLEWQQPVRKNEAPRIEHMLSQSIDRRNDIGTVNIVHSTRDIAKWRWDNERNHCKRWAMIPFFVSSSVSTGLGWKT